MSNEKIQSKSKEKIIKHRDNLNNETPLKTEKKKFESPDKKNANLSHNDNIGIK